MNQTVCVSLSFMLSASCSCLWSLRHQSCRHRHQTFILR